MSEVVIIVPMLTRAHRVAPLLDSISAATTVDHTVMFVCTDGDTDVIDAARSSGARLEVIGPNTRGDYAKKINHGFRHSDEPFVFLAADDLRFHPRWFEEAVHEFRHPWIGVVGTQDLANRRVLHGLHSTHSLVRRAYIDEHGTIDEDGKVLHEGYIHEFVDDELVQTAKHRKAFAFAARSVVEHLHPMVGKAPSDALYARQQTRMRRDRHRFIRRQTLWT